jgi:hypothetical protein
MPKLPLYLLSVSLFILAPNSWAQTSTGILRICKEAAEEYGPEQQAWWRKEVLIPAGTVFSDVGTIEPGNPWIKLRVYTLASVRIVGKARCITVGAKIGGPQDWGGVHTGEVRGMVLPSDNRLLEVLGPLDRRSAPPKSMYPWASVPPVSATVETAIR